MVYRDVAEEVVGKRGMLNRQGEKKRACRIRQEEEDGVWFLPSIGG